MTLLSSRPEEINEIVLELDSEFPDVLHALSGALEYSGANLAKATAAYELVSRVAWPGDEFGERAQILCRLAYLAWNICLRESEYGSMTIWASRCVENVQAQEIVRDFLARPFEDRSPTLSRRFLNDPAIQLAVATQLAEDRNRLPAPTAKRAAFTYSMLTESGRLIEDEATNYIAGAVALSAAVAAKHLGNLHESTEWLDRAEKHSANTKNNQAILPQVEFVRLTLAFERHNFREVVEQVPGVLARLERTGPPMMARRCQFLEAMARKEFVGIDDGLTRLRQLEACLGEQDDRLLLGLVLMTIGEIVAKQGQPSIAMSYLTSSHRLIRDDSWALAGLHTVVGEVLRDRGNLLEAIEAYTSAVAMYCSLEMELRSAYLRLLLAEALIAAGRNSDAKVEILRTLPIFEREGILLDALAAIALLQQSARREVADTSVLRSLREHIDQMRRR